MNGSQVEEESTVGWPKHPTETGQKQKQTAPTVTLALQWTVLSSMSLLQTGWPPLTAQHLHTTEIQMGNASSLLEFSWEILVRNVLKEYNSWAWCSAVWNLLKFLISPTSNVNMFYYISKKHDAYGEPFHLKLNKYINSLIKKFLINIPSNK